MGTIRPASSEVVEVSEACVPAKFSNIPVIGKTTRRKEERKACIGSFRFYICPESRKCCQVNNLTFSRPEVDRGGMCFSSL